MNKANVDLHNEALAIFQKLESKGGSTVSHARNVVSNYNDRRKALTAKLKPILVAIDEKFTAGEIVGGAASMKEYCQRFKHQGCLGYARVRQIISGKSGNENKKVKSLDLGDMVKVNGATYQLMDGGAKFGLFLNKIKDAHITGRDTLAAIYSLRNKFCKGNADTLHSPHAKAWVEKLREEKAAHPEWRTETVDAEIEQWESSVESRMKDEANPRSWVNAPRVAPKPEPVITHARLSARRSVCESVFVNRPKIKGKVMAGEADDATCPDCRRVLDENKNKTGSTQYVPPQPELSEPAKALAAAVGSAVTPSLAGLSKADREYMERHAADIREGNPRESCLDDEDDEPGMEPDEDEEHGDPDAEI